MEGFLTFLNNPWVTGIGGGVISGLLVYFVTSNLLSRKENKEYTQKVTTANNELLYTMRPLIAQKEIPSKAVLESVIESTARKYEVNKKDLPSVPLLIDDLIREVLENAFLDSKQKMDFCNKINELRSGKEPFNKMERVYQEVIYRHDKVSSQYVSILLAFVTATTFLFISFFIPQIFDRSNLMFDGLNNLASVSALTLLTAIIPIFAMTMTLLVKKLKDFENKQRHFIKKEEKD